MADYMWDHVHGYCDIEGHYYDDRRYYPNGRFGGRMMKNEESKSQESENNIQNQESENNIQNQESKDLYITGDIYLMQDALKSIVNTLTEICNEDIVYFNNDTEILKECGSKLIRLSALINNLKE